MILFRWGLTWVVNYLFNLIWLRMNSHATISLRMIGLKKPLKGEYQVALFEGTLKTIIPEETVIWLE
ncbi:hypothetical protein CWN98_00380 [Vibrio splendidus]|nr:hypothetical protein CWN98_00380 [Vibrio splendidus]PTP50872.1 hypothetical protein CWO10_01085 [Vibrio splendidus]